MNVNLLQPSGPWPTDENLWAKIQDNQDVVAVAVKPQLTGKVALIDARGIMPGVFQVWHETRDGYWVWVDEEGVVHSNCHPTDPEHEPDFRAS